MRQKAESLEHSLKRFYRRVYISAGIALCGIVLSAFDLTAHSSTITELDLPKLLAVLGILGVVKAN